MIWLMLTMFTCFGQNCQGLYVLVKVNKVYMFWSRLTRLYDLVNANYVYMFWSKLARFICFGQG
jgi:hypothetical protein